MLSWVFDYVNPFKGQKTLELPTQNITQNPTTKPDNSYLKHTTDFGGKFLELKYGKVHYVLHKPEKEIIKTVIDPLTTPLSSAEPQMQSHTLEDDIALHDLVSEISDSDVKLDKGNDVQDGGLVVLFHGASMFSFVWNRLAQLFVSKSYTVLAFDFYGHGYSAVPTGVDYNAELFVEQAEQVLEQLELMKHFSSFVLVGHSMGGAVATEFAAKHPNWVSQLVLLNAVGMPVNTKLPNVLPFTLHYLCGVVRKTRLFDVVVTSLAKVLQYQGELAKITHHDLTSTVLKLSEEEAEDMDWDDFDMNASCLPVNLNPGPEVVPAPSQPNKPTPHSVSMDKQKNQDSKPKRRRFQFTVPIPNPLCIPLLLIENVFKSLSAGKDYVDNYTSVVSTKIASNVLDEATLRALKGVHFVWKTWVFQLRENAGRDHVMLSILRNFPLLDANHSSSLTKIQAPILIIWGKDDTLLPEALLKDFSKHLPHAHVICLPGDHGVFLQRPKKIFDSIWDFMHSTTSIEV